MYVSCYFLNATFFAALHTCDVSWIGTFPNGRRLNVKKVYRKFGFAR